MSDNPLGRDIFEIARNLGLAPDWEPVPGFYSIRMVAKGVRCALRIMRVDDDWIVLLSGKPMTPRTSTDPWGLTQMGKITLYAKPITEREYDKLLRETEFFDPYQPIDLNDPEPIF